MSFRIPRQGSMCVDHSSVYFKNERLAGSMRQRVDSLSKDKQRAFLRCQAEIADVRENLNKLHAFREAVGNITIIQLTRKKYNYRMPNINHGNETSTTQVTNRTRARLEGSFLHKKTDQITVDVNQVSHMSRLSPLKSRVIPDVRTSASNCVPPDIINPNPTFSQLCSPTSTTFPHKTLLLETYNLERNKPTSLGTASVSHKQRSTQVLNKPPLSTKEQWAGLGDALSPKITSSAATARPRFRRVCTAVSSTKCSEALSLRRLRELYILDESKYVMYGQRQANFMRYLLVLNRKQNRNIQVKVRNFLDELGGKKQ